jgi:putative ABC transport system permease protein
VLVVVLAGGGVAVAVTDPFAGTSPSGAASSALATPLATVTSGPLSSQTQVSATLGFTGSYSVVNQATGTFTSLPPPGQVTTVDGLLAAQANPENPSQVNVSQPSAALTAQADAQGAFNGLFLGLGAVALLVGAVGVANIMVISVLERRSEIGLRRALGATRGHIRIQFLSEAILLSALGGAAGVAAGILATVGYATARNETVEIPAIAWAGGLGAAIAIGAIAGLIPALRAARLSPTEALRTA